MLILGAPTWLSNKFIYEKKLLENQPTATWFGVQHFVKKIGTLINTQKMRFANDCKMNCFTTYFFKTVRSFEINMQRLYRHPEIFTI